MADLSVISDVNGIIESNTKKLENFLSVQNDVANKFQQSTKLLYDFTKNETNRQNAALPELVVEDFDEEQIWQQLEIQNEAELAHFLTGVSRLLSGNKSLDLPVSLTMPEEKIDEVEQEQNDDNEDNDDDDDEDEEMEEGMNDEVASEHDSDSDMDVDIDKDGNLRKLKKNEAPKSRKNKKPSIVDDKFFKLEELDEYLTKEDKKESNPNIEEDEESDEDDESVDLFKNESEEDEEDDDEGKMIKYADFFDSPDDGGRKNFQEINEDFGEEDDDDDEHKEPEGRKRKAENDGVPEKRVKFNLTNDSDTDSEENNRFGEDQQKSTLESRQERLSKRIEELEKEAISDKPWQLKGEVTAANRPKDSLLEEFVEFDVTSRPAPIITEKTTLTLEDIIKRRIKDKAWDDVERKIKPVETPMEYKKKLVLDQEKSKKSLAEIYEDAYLKQKEALNPDADEKEEEEPKEHKEVRKMMTALFSKLDALSNFHYTPKPAIPELKIISNVPAINMEEVAPVATSDATLLAPEEVKEKKRGDEIGKSERTKTDIKRDMKKKKKEYGRKHKSVTKFNDRNVSVIDKSGQQAPKSSTAFFTQLQDEISIQKKPIKKKEKMTHTAVKLKL